MENGLYNMIEDPENDNTWDCRSCRLQFDSRGKRDAHHRKTHQKLAIAESLSGHKMSVRRSTTGKFDCSCGKEFLHAQSLQLHYKRCYEPIENEVESSENEQGMYYTEITNSRTGHGGCKFRY
jgi:hypothetical protein